MGVYLYYFALQYFSWLDSPTCNVEKLHIDLYIQHAHTCNYRHTVYVGMGLRAYSANCCHSKGLLAYYSTLYSVRQWSNWNRDNCYSGRWIARAIKPICSINRQSISFNRGSSSVGNDSTGYNSELYPHIETFWELIVHSLMLQISSITFAIQWSNRAWLSLWRFLHHMWMLPLKCNN